MAKKTNFTVKDRNGNERSYYRMTKVVGHKLNDKGVEVPVRKTFTGSCKADAERKYEAFKAKQNAGIETKAQYFGVIADTWIQEFFINDGSLKDSTKARYIAAWNRRIKTAEFYHQPLDTITAKTLQATYNRLYSAGCPVSEIKMLNKILRKFYRYLDFEGLGRDVTGSLTIPREKANSASDAICVWSDDEIQKIFAGFATADNRFRHRFLIVLAYYTGCRKSELLALKYDDITADGICITKQIAEISDGMEDGKMKTHLSVTDPKTKKSVRTIPVDPIVMDELKLHKEWHIKEQLKNGYRTDFLFTTDTGGFYDPKNLDRSLERYYKRIGVEPKTLHTYRHTYASNLCRFGVPIQTASVLLGHDSIETTARFYVNVAEDSKKDAVMKLRQVMEA